MKAVAIRTEYLLDPVGLGVPSPRIFWNDEGEGRQKEVLLSYSINGGEERKKTFQTSSMHIDFPEALSSRDRVEFALSLKEEGEGDFQEKSQTHSFEMGLLEQSDFKAKWIAGDYSPKKSKRYPADCFRKSFLCPKPKKGRAYLSAEGFYGCYLNGKRVGEFVLAPGSTDYRKRIQYQTYDITPLLLEGENVLEVLLADGWYRGSIGAKGRTYVFGKQTKFYAQIEIEGQDGSKLNVLSDSSWNWSNDGPIRFADFKDGEIVDARMAPSYKGKAKEAKVKTPLLASDNLTLKENESFAPESIRFFSSNHAVLAFPSNWAGFFAFSLQAKAGQKIDAVLGEMLDEEGHVTLTNIQCVRKGKKTPLQEVHYICKEGRNDYSMRFSYAGFRYAEVTSEAPIKAEDFRQIAVYSKFEETSSFSCSEPLLNVFHENVLRSLKSNSADVPTDCPTRERMGWTGDSQLFFPSASYLTLYAPFARKHLRDVFDRQWRSGRLPQIAPYNAEDWYMATMNGSSGWADVGILMPYAFYQKYGDERILQEHWEGIRKYALFLLKRQGKWGGIYAKPLHLKRKYARYAVNRGQSYGEWAEPVDVKPFYWYDFASPHPEVSTAYTAHCLSLYLEIASILGKPKDGLYEKAKKSAEGAKLAYQELRKTKAYPLDTDRQAELVRPLAFRLLNKEQEEYARKRLVEAMDHYRWRIGTGFLSTPMILSALAENSPDDAYRLLLNKECPGWLFMAEHSTGTVWESWEGQFGQKGTASLNHYSKGALVEWLYGGMLGIQVDGDNHFSLGPIIGKGIDWAKGTYRSIYGPLSLSWKKEGEKTSFHIEVPGNCSASFSCKGVKKDLTPGKHDFLL